MSNLNLCAGYYIVDNVAPVLVGFLSLLRILYHSCSASCQEQLLQECSDNCTYNLTMNVATEVVRSANPAECEYYNYEEHRTWTATDLCGNSDSYTQVITRVDNVNPTLSSMGPSHHTINTTANCEGALSLDLTGGENDNCASNAYLIKYYKVIDINTGDTVKIGNGLNATGNYYEGQYRFEFTVVDPCRQYGYECSYS
ncbi:MAG: hypothetical protein R2784_10485 [Saprospiraceae bacterium]